MIDDALGGGAPGAPSQGSAGAALLAFGHSDVTRTSNVGGEGRARWTVRGPRHQGRAVRLLGVCWRALARLAAPASRLLGAALRRVGARSRPILRRQGRAAGMVRRERDARRHALRESQVVGRAEACDLRLDSDQVSREHAVIWWEAGQWHVRDLDSLNGTFVLGRRLVPHRAMALERGDAVSFGEAAETWVVVSSRPPGAPARGATTAVVRCGNGRPT